MTGEGDSSPLLPPTTPPSGPTPEEVLAVFDRPEVMKRRAGPKQVTPQIRELAELLSPGVLAKQAYDCTRSAQAYFGARLLAESVLERLRALKAATALPLAPSAPIERHQEYGEACDELRALGRLLRALSNAERFLFFQRGQLAVIRHGFADTKPAAMTSITIMLVYAAVERVLSQSGDLVGVSSKSVACKLTAALLTDFAQSGVVVTADMVSGRVREGIKHKDKPWP